VSVGILVSFIIFMVVPQSPTEIFDLFTMTFTDGIFPSVIPLQSPMEYPSVITVEFYKWKYYVGNLVAGIIFFGSLSHL